MALRSDIATLTVLTGLLSCVHVRAVGDLDGRQEPALRASTGGPVTPGSVALLANRLDASTVEELRAHLAHEDPVIRAVAARIAGVAKVSGLAPAVGAALERERDQSAAAEQVRALLFFDTAGSREPAERHFAAAGTPAIHAYVESLSRSRPERLADRMEELLRMLPPTEATDFKSPVAVAILQHPGVRERLLRAWLRAAPHRAWRGLLERLWSLAAPVDVTVLREALTSEDPSIRQETVWAVVASLSLELPIAAAALDATLLPEAASTAQNSHAVTWEVFGRELVARRHRKASTPDRAGLVKTEAARHHQDASVLWGLEELTRDERAALRDALGDRLPNKDVVRHEKLSDKERGRQPRMRTAPLPWPRFLVSLLDASRCKVSNSPRFAAIGIEYRPDGRPARAQADSSGLPAECESALAALSRMTVAGADYPVEEGTLQWVVLPIHREFVTCASAAAAETPVPRPLDHPSALPTSPRKIRDVRPVYPAGALQARQQGVVVLDSTISTAGCITSVQVIRSTVPMLDFAALRAVTEWRFTPTLVDGRPVPVIMTVTVNFTLQ